MQRLKVLFFSFISLGCAELKDNEKGKNKTFNSAGLLVVKHTKNIDIHMIITRRLKSDYTSREISYMF